MALPSDAGSKASVHSKSTSQPDSTVHDADVERQTKPENDESDPADKEVATKDPNLVDWDGPDDPANPMNWKTSKKIAAIGIVSAITFLSPLSSTIIAPATAEIQESFGSTNESLGAFVTSVYLLGYTFGPLVIAPLSEIYGRAIVYNVCNTIFLIFTIACAVSNNLSALIVFRFFAGVGASCPVTLGAGTIADMVPKERRGLAMASWIMGPLIGPTVGPLAGGFLAQAKGWRWVFWLLAIVIGAVWLAGILFIRESYAYVILQRKTNRLRNETGNQDLRSALDTGRNPTQLFKTSILRPVKMLFLSPIVFLLSFYMAMIYGFMYLMFTTFPRVFSDQYGFSSGIVGLTYIGIGAGSFIGLVLCASVSDRLVVVLTERNGGVGKPEFRIPPIFMGALCLPVALFWYGWTAEKEVQWMAPIIGTGIYGVGLFLIFLPISAYLVDAFTVYAASATAAGTVFRSLLGALLPLAGGSMYDALGVGWGTSVLGFIALAFIPMPLILWTFGERIRNSKFSPKEW